MFSLVWIMPPTMATRSAGRPAVVSRGGGTGGRAGSDGGRTRGRSGNQGDGRIDGQGGQVGSQGSEVNNDVNGVPDLYTIIAQQLQNLLPTIVAQVGDQSRGQGNGRNLNGDAVSDNIRGDMESVQDMSGCKDSQKVKYTASLFVGKALTWWNSQIHTRGREATVGMSWEDFKTLTREKFCSSNEMQKLETELWNHTMVGAGHAAYTDRFHELARENGGETSKNRNVRDDNKGTRTRNAFAIITNPVGRENTGTVPKFTICSTYNPPGVACRTCFNYNRLGHFAKDCRVTSRNVNLIIVRNPIARACYECGSTDHIKSACPRLNQAQRPEVNHQNQVVAVNGGQGRGNQGNQVKSRAFMLGAEEARQDPNIMTKTFTLGIEPSDLGFSYEIEIASGQLVEIDKVIRGCKLEIEGHVIDINLIPFGSGSFNVIVGMDWLSDQKAKIICHEKVVRIPLLDEKVLRVLGEKPEENVRKLMSVIRSFATSCPNEAKARKIELKLGISSEEEKGNDL
nr:reverse transcriptase domain-containing protein [Tanacetum cinerariifolium]GEX90179.1 reverse transcriptase domain-containing protein [Tanacetum cinerariifolium]